MACLGVPRVVEEVITMRVNCLTVKAHRPGGSGKEWDVVGTAKGQDKGEVIEMILADLPTGGK